MALAVALWPLLKRDRVARFWSAGMVLSVVPASTTHPNNRLLFFCSLGAMGVVAQLWELYAITWRDLAVTGIRWFSRLVAALLTFMHLVISPLALPVVRVQSALLTTPIKRAFADVGPDVKGRDAVFISAPDYYSVQAHADGEARCRRAAPETLARSLVRAPGHRRSSPGRSNAGRRQPRRDTRKPVDGALS